MALCLCDEPVMHAADDTAVALAKFGLHASACIITALGNAGGFSGAKLWRVTNKSRDLCLRRWPANYPDETRLRFIHAVMEFAGMQLDFVPKLQRSNATGDTAVRHGEHLWELTTWLPGEADFQRRSSLSKLSAAMQALAKVHLALEHFPTRMTGSGTSPGIAERQNRLRELRNSLPQLRAQLPLAAAELQMRAKVLIRYFEDHANVVEGLLAVASQVTVPLQPCLRDVWHEHILFTGDAVTGIVDFDAVRIDTVAGDLARLLGSLVGDDAERRHAGISAYETLRPLADAERELIEVFDASSVLMSGMNWLTWLLIDGRQFPDMNRVYARLDEALGRIASRNRTATWQIT